MKADIRAMIPRPGVVELETQRRPRIGPGEVLLRTRVTLISPGTELALYTGTHSALNDPEVTFAKFPFHPGYAAISEVVEAADGAAGPGLATGSRIYHWGKHCTWTVLNPARDVWIPLRGDMVETRVVFARLAQISAVALHRVRSTPGKVLILGAGMIGNFCAQWFGLNTDAVIAIQDVNASRLALAARCGVRNCISGEREHAALFGAGGPDCVVEATGVPSLVPDALRWVRKGGDVILLGSPRGKQELDIYKHIHAKSVALIGAHEGGVPLKAEAGALSRQKLAEAAVEAIVAGRIRIDGLLSAEIEPDQIGRMYENMLTNRDTFIGAVVHWQERPAGAALPS